MIPICLGLLLTFIVATEPGSIVPVEETRLKAPASNLVVFIFDLQQHMGNTRTKSFEHVYFLSLFLLLFELDFFDPFFPFFFDDVLDDFDLVDVFFSFFPLFFDDFVDFVLELLDFLPFTLLVFFFSFALFAFSFSSIIFFKLSTVYWKSNLPTFLMVIADDFSDSSN